VTVSEFQLVVCSDADGGIQLRPGGVVDRSGAKAINEAVVSALRAGVPRVEVDLRDATVVGSDVERVLDAASTLGRHLAIELRVTGVARPVLDAASGPAA
jgi:anti-anti-sigma regulatory factor